MDLGISGFFKESKNEKLIDLEWLDVDSDGYENAPFSEHPPWDKKKELEDLWAPAELKYLEFNDPDKFLEIMTKSPSKEKPEEVVRFAKLQMTLGKKVSNVIADITSNFKPETIKLAEKELRPLLKEESGLLGNVYIDPTAFKNCQAGSNFLKKNQAKLAKFVVKIDKCAGCSYNNSSNCVLFKKKLANKINYDSPSLHTHYYDHLKLSKNISKWEHTKENLRLAFTNNVNAFQGTQPAKSFITDSSPERALKKAEKITIINPETVKIERKLAKILMSGANGNVLRETIAKSFAKDSITSNKKLFQSYIDKQGSLGRIFVETKIFNNGKEFNDFMKNASPKISHIVNNNHNIGNFEIKSLYQPSEGKRLQRTIVGSVNEIPKSVFAETIKNILKNPVNDTFDKLGMQGYSSQRIITKKTRNALEECFKTNPMLAVKKACLLTTQFTQEKTADSVKLFDDKVSENRMDTHSKNIVNHSQANESLISKGAKTTSSYEGHFGKIKLAIEKGFKKETIKQHLASKNVPAFEADRLIKKASAELKNYGKDTKISKKGFVIDSVVDETIKGYEDLYSLKEKSIDKDIEIFKI